MRLRLDYGDHGLEVHLPYERVTVIEPVFKAALPDPHGALVGGAPRANRPPAAPRAGANAARSRHLCLRHHARATQARHASCALRGDAQPAR